MAATLTLRAVDKSYFYYEDTLSFYHAHLRISDLDKNTSQPYLYQDLVVGLVGEIYNKEFLLRKIGIQKNPDNFTECEVIARAYDMLGENFINFVNGEFSIFIYDKKEKKYLFFRDRWGTNNLYYSIQNDILYFASEIKALIFQEPILNKKNFIEHMTFQFGISPSTIVEGISILRPGTYMIFQNTQIRIEIFDPYIFQNPEMTLIDTLEQAVKRRIPYFQDEIFLSLSGGPDSNLILYFLKKYYQ
jgi:asparagine synthase (glutamine-hydrolysing)